MASPPPPAATPHSLLQRLTRKNVLAGLMFILIAALGLWIARDYPVGTLRRMGSGFMPQLLCWLLMGLGAIVLVQGLLHRDSAAEVGGEADAVTEEVRENYWSVAVVALSLVAFALTIEALGLIAAIVLLVLVASLAYRGLTWRETITTAIVLVVLSWVVFVLGLGMTAKLLPEFSAASEAVSSYRTSELKPSAGPGPSAFIAARTAAGA